MDILNVTTVALCLTLKQIYLIYWHHNLRDAKSQKSTFTSVVYAVRVLRKTDSTDCYDLSGLEEDLNYAKET